MSGIQRITNNIWCYCTMRHGNEKKSDEEDKIPFIDIGCCVMQGARSYVYAICLMDNHIHILICDDKEDIADVMKRITAAMSFVLIKSIPVRSFVPE